MDNHCSAPTAGGHPKLLLCFALLLAFAPATWMRAEGLPGAAVTFGLTNLPLGQAIVEGNTVYNLGPNGSDGVSIFLGEADSGLHFYPYTSDTIDGGDYMTAKAYGRVDGLDDHPICIVRGRKVGDPGPSGFNPLTWTSRRWVCDQSHLPGFLRRRARWRNHFCRRRVGDAHGFQRGSIIRVNPCWRTPAGEICAVFDFTGYIGFELPGRAEGDDLPFGQRLVVKANNPARTVEFVSRMDITTGGHRVDEDDLSFSDGLASFIFEDLRLGVFHRAHKALGVATMTAAGGKLTIGNLTSAGAGGYSDQRGSIEVERAIRFDLDLLPFSLAANGSGLKAGMIGDVNQPGDGTQSGYQIGSVTLVNAPTSLELTPVFYAIGTNTPRVRVEVYIQDNLIGRSSALSLTPLVTLAGHPRLISLGGAANSETNLPRLTLRFDRITLIQVGGSAIPLQFFGDEIRVIAADPIQFEDGEPGFFENITAFSLTSAGVPSFTILGERAEFPPPPALGIARSGDKITLTWPDPNRAYTLDAASSFLGGFEATPEPVAFAGNRATVTLTAPIHAAQFFRLRRNR